MWSAKQPASSSRGGPTTSALLAEVEVAEGPELAIRQDELGTHSFGRVEYEIRDGEIVYADEGPVGVMVTLILIGGSSAFESGRPLH